MATLNVKGFPDELYQQLQEEAKREHRSVSQQVVHLLSDAMKRRKKGSITELHGLGKEIWAGIDSDKFLEEERNSWD